jgi:hypothetical protein
VASGGACCDELDEGSSPVTPGGIASCTSGVDVEADPTVQKGGKAHRGCGRKSRKCLSCMSKGSSRRRVGNLLRRFAGLVSVSVTVARSGELSRDVD